MRPNEAGRHFDKKKKKKKKKIITNISQNKEKKRKKYFTKHSLVNIALGCLNKTAKLLEVS